MRRSRIFALKFIPNTMTNGYEAWWDVGMAAVSEKASVKEAYEEVIRHREEARKY